MEANEPRYDKTNKVACALREDSDQPGLIRVLAVCMKLATFYEHSDNSDQAERMPGWSES